MNQGEASQFLGHYVDWRRGRVRAIIQHYGRAWFPGKRVLELGCGYGHIGINFAMLGAQVTFSDGRQKHLDEIALLWPSILPERLILANLQRDWPFEGHWDLIIHQGLLYHLTKWRFSLRAAAKCCSHMALETETLDSDDPTARKVIEENPDSADSAIDGKSIRVPPSGIEAALTEVGFHHELNLDSNMNTGVHKYNWAISNSGESSAQTRRFWWCWRSGHGPS